MASTPSSSSTDLERKLPEKVGVQTTTAPNVEYERFLVLDAQFQGPGKKVLLRKLDFRLLPTLSFLYLMCSLDKSNAGNAKLFGFLEDVGMTSRQFNLALIYLFFTYGLCEPISNIALRRLGPKIWFPCIVIAWGLITTLTCLVKSYGGYIIIRLCLGISEAGLYPGSYFILSMWYTPQELATRMAIFYGANTGAGAFGGVIAYGVGNLDELEYAQLRIKYANGPDAPTYHFRWSDVLAAAKNRKTFFMMMMFWWGGSVPTYSLSYTLPTMVKNLGYSAVRAQALTTPPYIFATIVCVFVGWASDRYQNRFVAIMSSYTLGLIGIIILWITTHHPELSGVSYFAILLAAAGYSTQAPIVGAWTSVNVINPSKRASAIGLLMLFGSVGGGSVGSNIYLAEQAPVYPLGFGFSVGTTVLGAMIPATVHWWLMRRENAKKERLDIAEVQHQYIPAELGEMGEDSPLFRYTL
ncbi:MFS general substrate transporter [Amniculicola lignicola CBS 123094]|uniref:MFS general substrate transporter n=1 Tax=Amniculicola lignicola CBS 123094 TaxID=1392246 RepID=A0A6A5WIS3_9PLEO|nr:MFS general substrate transporter [Amniculicola lignicola CBS 123094]